MQMNPSKRSFVTCVVVAWVVGAAIVTSGGAAAAKPKPPSAAKGDDGTYACSLLTKAEIAAAIGGRATKPMPSGGGPPVATNPATSKCIMTVKGTARSTIVSWTVDLYKTAADAAADAAASNVFPANATPVPGVGTQAVADATPGSEVGTILAGSSLITIAYQDGNQTLEQLGNDEKAGVTNPQHLAVYEALVRAIGKHL